MTRLNHIGIAVSHLPRLSQLFLILGLPVNHSEEVLEQGVRTHFIPLPDQGPSIELLEVLDPQGTVAQFIQKRGPGIHHIALTVDPGALDPLSEKLKAAGYRMVYPAPKVGAHGAKINFIHPATADGVLIELMEEQG